MTEADLAGTSWTLSRISRHSAVRFVIVGGLTLAVDGGSLFLFHGVAGIWLPLATAMAFAAAFVVNFGLNRAWAFSASDGAVGRQVGRYLLLVAVNLVLNVIGVATLTWAGLPYLVSKLVVAVVLAVVNYFVSRRWIFR